MRRMWSALILTAALAVPIGAAPAAAAPAFAATAEPAAVVVRVYDPYRRDYHRWDRAEQARYRAYLRERHQSYVQYQHQREAQRRAYWHWRHDHER